MCMVFWHHPEVEEGRVPGGLAKVFSCLFNERSPILIIGFWALLYAFRPFTLGLYHDDWWSLVEAVHGSAPFSLTRLHEFVGSASAFAPRPVSGFITFLVNSIAGTSPFVYQACSSVLVLLAALSLRAWFRGLLYQTDAFTRSVASNLGTAFWLSAPWSVAGTAWPVAALGVLPAQIFFTEAARQILPPKRVTAANVVKLGLGLLASYLAYEAFYFHFLVVVLFYMIAVRNILPTWSARAWVGGTALMAQLLALGLNRYMAAAAHGNSKTLNPHWPNLVLANCTNLPHELLIRFGNSYRLWLAVAAVLLAVAVIALVVAIFLRQTRTTAATAFGCFAAGMIALPITALTYGLANYELSSTGVNSRTFVAISWALALVCFALVIMLGLIRLRFLRFAAMILPLWLIAMNARAQLSLVSDWAAVWKVEKEVLAQAPIAALKALPPDSRVLYIGPSYYHDVVIFGAYWDLTAAVSATPALSAGRKAFQGCITNHPATSRYNWSWDGQTLTQECPGYWKVNFPAKHLFVWNYDEHRMFEAKDGFQWTGAK